MGSWKEHEIEHRRAKARERMWKMIDAHICIDCKGKVEGEGHRYCEACRTKRREAKREKVAIDRELGLCTKCEQALARKGRDTCLACAVHESELRHKQYERRKAGMPQRVLMPQDEGKIRQIADCYRSGNTLEQVGKQFGFSSAAAYLILTRNGVTMRRPWEYRKKVEERV